MIHSRLFTEDVKYRTENLFNCVSPEDRPLIVQVSQLLERNITQLVEFTFRGGSITIRFLSSRAIGWVGFRDPTTQFLFLIDDIL